MTTFYQLAWLLIVSCLFTASNGFIVSYAITTTWNNQPLPVAEYVNVSFFPVPSHRYLGIEIRSPFYNDTPPDAQPGTFPRLYNFEFVSVFFLGEFENYLELILGPHGHYLAYYLESVRYVVNSKLELHSYSAVINEKDSMWVGTAIVPEDYFPPVLNKFNVYAAHGQHESRRHLALFPTDVRTKGGPDFHNMETFQPIDLNSMIDIKDTNFPHENIIRRSLNSAGETGSNLFFVGIVAAFISYFMN